MSIEILSWSVTAGFTQEYVATVEAFDTEGVVPCGVESNKWIPITVTADIDSVSTIPLLEVDEDEPSDVACLTGVKRYVNGLAPYDAYSVDEQGARDLSLSVQSYHSVLTEKSVNSHHVTGTPRTMMEEIIEVYGGYDSANPYSGYDFSETLDNIATVGPVSGDNMLDQLQLLAAIGRSTLFVDETGTLRTGAWKDHTSPIDHRIPVELIQSVDKTVAPSRPPSRLKVNGGFVSGLSKGYRPLFQSSGSTGQDPSIPGQQDFSFRCVEGEQISEAENLLRFGTLGAQPTDVRNALWTITNETTGESLDIYGLDPNNDNSEAFTRISQQNGWANYGNEVLRVRARGLQRNQNEYNPNFNYPRNLRSGINPYEAAFFGPFAQMYRSHGAMPVAASMAWTSAEEDFDVANPNRFVTYLTDTCLQEEYGYIEETLDNPYVRCTDTMFDLAIRRFQEVRMARNTWVVKMAIMPCLSINDVVIFKLPESCPNEGAELTGIIIGMKVDNDLSNGSATMELTVATFCELGECEYCAENLLEDFEMLGEGSLYIADVEAGSPTTGVAYVANGGARITGGTTSATVTLEQPCTKVGRGYTFGFYHDGPGEIRVRNRVGLQLATSTFSGTGWKSVVIPPVALGTGLFFEWKATTGNTTLITKPYLTSCVTA